MTHEEILNWLRENDAARLAELWRLADETRRRHVGDAVHLRGLVEFSNVCARQCAYCGLRAGRAGLDRYRMTAEEILACAHEAVRLGYGTVVLQSGEDPSCSADWLAGVIRRIKSETALAVTLSVGERSDSDLAAWKDAGADRYLLRFETSNAELFRAIHPPLDPSRPDRFETLGTLKLLGYETGSGVMAGIPGQTYDDLARSIARFAELDLDMIGCGPFIAHPDTPLARRAARLAAPEGEQVPATETMAYKVIALARQVCPDTNIPSTTAVATLAGEDGRDLGLARGANVVMPNLTPATYRARYEIYPAKAGVQQDGDYHEAIRRRILAMGREVGRGRGDSPNHRPATAVQE